MAVLIVLLPGVNLAAGDQPLLVALSAGHRALRREGLRERLGQGPGQPPQTPALRGGPAEPANSAAKAVRSRPSTQKTGTSCICAPAAPPGAWVPQAPSVDFKGRGGWGCGELQLSLVPLTASAVHTLAFPNRQRPHQRTERVGCRESPSRLG